MRLLPDYAQQAVAAGTAGRAAGCINAPTGCIAGGADEMPPDTVAQHMFGHSRDHRPDKAVPFNHIA